MTDHGHRRLLRPRRERPRGGRAAEQRDELAPFLIDRIAFGPRQPGPVCRISNWRGAVSGVYTPVHAWTWTGPAIAFCERRSFAPQ